jgi:hypothetical protein
MCGCVRVCCPDVCCTRFIQSISLCNYEPMLNYLHFKRFGPGESIPLPKYTALASVYYISTSTIRNVPTTLHIECLWLFEVFCISILVVVLNRQLTVSISFLCFQDTCEMVTSYGMITSFQFMARGMHFSLSHHVQPVRGTNLVFSPVSVFP